MMHIRPSIASLKGEASRIRRALHRIPEPCYEEYKTQAFILEELKCLGADSVSIIAGTGVKAVFLAKDAVDTVAFRADMDALTMSERTGAEFASCHEGFMHACGHDGHMTMALLTARIVSGMRDTLRRNVVFLFQPAEEGGAGAARCIDDGALESPHVDSIYGFHIWPDIPSGMIGVRGGALLSQAGEFNITVRGTAGHGANPHTGRDAILGASQLVCGLQTIVSRSVDPLKPAVLSIGKFTAGTRRNIICHEALLEGTIRAFDEETYSLLMRRINDVARGTAIQHGLDIDVVYPIEPYPPVVNDDGLASDYAALIGDTAYMCPQYPISEDFSFYQKQTRGFFALLGSGMDKSLHTSDFDFDEAVMLTGIEANMRVIDV